MPYPTPAHDPACRDQLAAAVATLHRRAQSILGEQCEATPDYTTSWLWNMLCGEDLEQIDQQLSIMAAYQIVKDLVDRTDIESAEWWGTPLGRAVCWWVGWPGDPTASVQLVPPPVVRHVLGITRQAAFQRGDIWSDDLRTALHERWPAIRRGRHLTSVSR